MKTILRPALIIISIMVLIQAGIVIYVYETGKSRDAQIQENITHARLIAESNRLVIQNLKVERDIRSDQTCELFETDHLQKVQSLRRTYKYLAQLTPEEASQPLNRFIITILPQNEQEAVIDRAPEYCDEPNIGLPEPDPKIPDRPKVLVQQLGERPDYPTASEVASEHKNLSELKKQNPGRK